MATDEYPAIITNEQQHDDDEGGENEVANMPPSIHTNTSDQRVATHDDNHNGTASSTTTSSSIQQDTATPTFAEQLENPEEEEEVLEDEQPRIMDSEMITTGPESSNSSADNENNDHDQPQSDHHVEQHCDDTEITANNTHITTHGASAVMGGANGGGGKKNDEEAINSQQQQQLQQQQNFTNHRDDHNKRSFFAENSTEEIPMVAAELVPPSVQAVQVVFDEGPQDHALAVMTAENNPDNNHDQQSAADQQILQQMELEIEEEQLAESAVPSHPDRKRNIFSKQMLWWVVLLLVVCLGIIILVSVMMHRQHSSQYSDTTTASETVGSNNAVTNTSAPAPIFPYHCFTSTKELFLAQLENPTQKLFIICPNTHIKIGVLANALLNDTTIINGDWPLTVLHENIEIRCGLDGHRHNQCILDGGFIQVLISPLLPSVNDASSTTTYQSTISRANDNLVIRGLTMTGQIIADYTLSGNSLVLSNAGKNMTIVDCLWENITGPSGILYIGENMVQTLSGYSLGVHDAELTIVNTTFRNILTYDGPLVDVWNQRVSFVGCTFENTRISSYPGTCFIDIYDWCQTLILCSELSWCHIQDLCANNVEFAGHAPLLIAEKGAEIVVEGNLYLGDTRPHAVTVDLDHCASGFVSMDTKIQQHTCIEEGDPNFFASNWTRTDKCMHA